MEQRLARNAVARAAARHTATTAFVAKALGAARPAGPKGGLGQDLFLKNANGYATDPVSQDRIPTSRAVRVGRHYYDAKTLRALLKHNRSAVNPLTRQPFPSHILQKYRPPRVHAGPFTSTPRQLPRQLTEPQRGVWHEAVHLGRALLHEGADSGTHELRRGRDKAVLTVRDEFVRMQLFNSNGEMILRGSVFPASRTYRPIRARAT